MNLCHLSFLFQNKNASRTLWMRLFGNKHNKISVLFQKGAISEWCRKGGSFANRTISPIFTREYLIIKICFQE
jgi:hypothetical protein